MFSNIPYELQTHNQWVVWRFEQTDNGKPTKVPYQVNGRHANVMDKTTWSDFNSVINAVKNYDGIGFVLTEEDPYCFVDLDHTEDPDVISTQHLIFQNLNETYAEFSPSGKGLHIICRAKTAQGRKKGDIELYSKARFMTMTGNVYNQKMIVDCQPQIDTLYNALSKTDKVIQIADQEQHYSDNDICLIASQAENGEKFVDLYQGNYKPYYKSQSEADHALINIIAYYSRNIAQIERIFKASELGKRKKAERSDYVGKMISRSFDNYIPPVDIGALAENMRKQVQTQKTYSKGRPLNLQLMTLAELFPNEIAPIDNSKPLPDLKNMPFSYSEISQNVEFEDLPDGAIKEIARFIYAQSPRPVKTISMVTALAFMSGICGRSYNISGTGLNNYFVLLAPTGIGKEGMSKGVNKMLNAIMPQQPLAKTFIGMGELVSGISLLRYLSDETQCCLTVQGEFGLTMQRMTGRMASAPMLQLRKILLELYGKSGKGEIMRGSVYADSNKNISAIDSPAFSLLAESTPETFYDALSDSLVDEGLMSRFNIIECGAKRPPLNKSHHAVDLPSHLHQWILTIVSNSLTLNATNTVINIEIDKRAEELLDNFNNFCDDIINKSTDESYRQLWNRGHLKVLKIAGLFAIGDNMYKPVVTISHVRYAIDFVQKSIKTLYERYTNNEIGFNALSDNKQLKDVCTIFRRCILNPEKLNFPHPQMKEDFVFPAQFIMRGCTSYKSFRLSNMSNADIFKRATSTLESWGVITEVRLHELAQKYNYRGKAWAISDPKFFLNEEYKNYD